MLLIATEGRGVRNTCTRHPMLSPRRVKGSHPAPLYHQGPGSTISPRSQVSRAGNTPGKSLVACRSLAGLPSGCSLSWAWKGPRTVSSGLTRVERQRSKAGGDLPDRKKTRFARTEDVFLGVTCSSSCFGGDLERQEWGSQGGHKDFMSTGSHIRVV